MHKSRITALLAACCFSMQISRLEAINALNETDAGVFNEPMPNNATIDGISNSSLTEPAPAYEHANRFDPVWLVVGCVFAAVILVQIVAVFIFYTRNNKPERQSGDVVRLMSP